MEKAEASDDPDLEKHPECHTNNRTSDMETQKKIDDWTKEDVYQWLIKVINVPLKYAEILYNEDVSGACLLLFDKKDLLDLGLRHGPAVQIIKKLSELKNPKGNLTSRATPEHSDSLVGTSAIEHYQGDKQEAKRHSRKSAELEVLPQLSIQENCDSNSGEHRWASKDKQKYPSSGGETLYVTAGFQENETSISEEVENIKHKIVDGTRTAQLTMLQLSHSTKPKNADRVQIKTKEHLIQSNNIVDHSKSFVKCVCLPRPFDEISSSFVYTKNEMLPPETGPSNLIDPVHEYKLMANTANASEKEVLKKFTDEVFRFAAGCMNSRTNGTIHFGVGDEPQYKHGQIIGLDITSPDKYIDEFDKRLKERFEENTNIAKICIRPPKFFQVKCPDNSNVTKWVIEVDIVPNYVDTLEKLFYTTLAVKEEGKNCKRECLFVRSGASTSNILDEKNPRLLQQKIKKVTDDVKSWASSRKSAEERHRETTGQSSQGQRLKQLITHGRDILESSIQFIVITNKCHVSQLEHLCFLKELKLFVVLDFDPESRENGTFSYYRKDRMANIHYPRLYHTTDNISTIIGKLNLFKQTSWVFCNGQVDENEADMPFSDSEWLKKRAADVNEMISFICKPDILSKQKLVVMFLLHSVVTDISSPIIETFCSIYQKLEGDDNMVCICKDSTVFEQWKHAVQTRCKTDITNKCIYELSMNEVNSTIQKTREPQTISENRYLPSFGSSSVLLTKKDEDQMTVLEILAQNECENTEIETIESFTKFKNKTEEEFYRGGQVKWWNFYLSEKPGSIPFIKRDKYEELHNLITPTEGYSCPCVTINLFHHPGCGGTTLAMHVLWNLRHKFRCAVLKNNSAQSSEIAVQVTQLLTYGKEEQSSYTPVLLLVDNWEDVEDLQRCILFTAHEKKKRESLMVIILNCERSQFPSESSRKSRIDNVFITNKLSTKEQGFFQMKLKELKGHHEKPETFYAFMIMTNDFSEKYIENLVCNILKDLDVSTKEGQLLSFLALLNTYVHGSCMSLSVCEEFVKIKNLWEQESLEEKMNPYSTLLICFNVEECGTYQGVRFLHQQIAENCLKILISKHSLTLSEITTNLLHCNQLYNSGMGKDILIQNILSMLITRQRKEHGDDKDTLFSPLIEEMPMAESKQVLTLATKRFDKNATVPQALARHFYLKEKDFTAALQWAQDARQKDYNSYIADTLGQVYKSYLKHVMEHEKEQKNELTPETLETCLQMAVKATMAFKDSQDLEKKNEQMDFLDQPTRKRQKTYNTSGYVGEMDVAMIIFDVLENIFRKPDEYQWDTLLHSLKNGISFHSFHETDQKTAEFLSKLISHDKFLFSLKPRMKEIFVFFENYFTYLKPRSIEREAAEDRNKRKVSEHFKRYVKLFCQSGEEKEMERASQPNLSLQQKLEQYRCFLEEKHADTFAGLLQCLSEKNGNQMELILKKWQFISENSKKYIDHINFILANIVLYCIKPKSTILKKYDELVVLLNVVLQAKGTYSDCTEAYYLAMLLLWPRKGSSMDNTMSRNICTYITSTKKSFHRRFSHMFPAKSAIAHFYLGKSKELKRILHKAKLDQVVDKEKHPNIHQLWQSGAIWRELEVQNLLQRVMGKTENGDIYVDYGGNLKIPVRPVYLGGLRSGCSLEEVSFFLGFTMEGPVAYDIKYATDL
ncbi:sterile alpha motif domain-containing protein 9-like [Xyrauchen texanus]|uniref:sterile alpha motif domain-containing protein 9-like n=1 Tax=Xyrauchen texanus TaxID=154827 RepID=UPI002241D6A3|nr:sterile alpha motif domain-containing protein 9-like [Xyrauchen texanus]